MTRPLLAMLLLAGVIWSAYMCWLSGYRSGYIEGEDEAWTRARAALMSPAPLRSARHGRIVPAAAGQVLMHEELPEWQQPAAE